jgi:WD40 repeat protein
METMDSEKDHINVIAISMEHSLIASGNSLGQVVTWDLETASMLHIQYAAKDENIVFLQFLADYPLMVAATAEGTISVWGTRGASTESLYNCVGRFKNTPIQISSDVAGFSYLSKLITCGTSEVV